MPVRIKRWRAISPSAPWIRRLIAPRSAGSGCSACVRTDHLLDRGRKHDPRQTAGDAIAGMGRLWPRSVSPPALDDAHLERGSMPNDNLTPSDNATLLVLMAEARPMLNTELVAQYGINVEKERRDKLNRLHLIHSEKAGRTFSH